MRLFLLTFLCTCALALTAQNERGKWFLDVGSSAYDQREATVHNLGAVTGGYFLTNNLLVGGEITSSQISLDPGLARLRFSPFLRYYLPGKRPLRFFAEAGARFTFEPGERATSLFGGVGAERRIAPNVMAYGRIRYIDESFGRGGLEFTAGLNTRFGGTKVTPETVGIGLRGDWLVSGRLRLRTSKAGFIRNTASVEIQALRVLSDNWMLEGEAYYGRSLVQEDEGIRPGRRITRNFGASAGARYVFRSYKRFRPHLGTGLSYYNGTVVRDLEDGTHEHRPLSPSFSAYIQGGFMYQLSDRVSLDFNGRYNFSLTGQATLGQAQFGLKTNIGKR